MKTKRLLWIVLIVALVITIALIALEQYYVATALIVGTLIMRHRELWSLFSKGKLPPVDERVRENTGKAIRNGFIYFAAATAFLMLPFSVILTEGPDPVQLGPQWAGHKAFVHGHLCIPRRTHVSASPPISALCRKR